METTGHSQNLPLGDYGFIGLGIMGYPMAQNLRKALPPTSTLVICELSQKQIDKFILETSQHGPIKVVSSPKEVSDNSDFIITMLPKGPHVLGVFTNPTNGLLAAAPSASPKFFLDCSTIETATSLKVGKAVESSGLGRFADSPVSGGPNGAYSATLTFMVGGSTEIFELVSPVLATMGKRDSLFHCGPAGAGLATKQINNYLSAVSIIGVCEAMNMGVRYGLDPKILSGVINVSSGKCYNSLDQNPVKGVTSTAAASKDFEGGFSMELCKGVVEMAVQLGKDVGAKNVLSDLVMKTFEDASQDERCKGKDCRSVYRYISE
ncbi:hypothetical protein V499_00710 [Pseudogymnoascus sp. VKM F-103]|uniref:3-hydroxyisobutyrate dehydrogenase n=1 Tax=Pseudogymnoascus verrucosus TaxID=342668 RepID=A0A1B8GMY4_9PEZI|nr:uncharacterized protein VE01_04700 [Pseudogymnoascus verrucosus]KFY80411.1 hypothetical protein V499_00710 [Pseudogymnoascus sp. VKM F-103]OBT97189.1 hypothetical protein VE01_04700 [Pseudogymnoascus verrucosus]